MIDCTFPEIPICLCLCALFSVIAIYEDSIKFGIVAIIILLYIPVNMFFLDRETFDQCNAQQNKERIESDKQFLLNNLESGQCGDVCIKESNSKHSTKFSHYTMCDVSIRICK
jgi:uncharacterized membrane protein YsdA (DUF1294 family)